jgi:DNA-binding NarL/FixJ family response regulator
MIDFNRELTPLQRQRIGRLLRYGHDAKEIAKRVSTTARLVEGQMQGVFVVLIALGRCKWVLFEGQMRTCKNSLQVRQS